MILQSKSAHTLGMTYSLKSLRKRAAELYAQRVARLNCHKIHTVLLIGNAQTRNKWLNDDLLHVSTLSALRCIA